MAGLLLTAGVARSDFLSVPAGWALDSERGAERDASVRDADGALVSVADGALIGYGTPGGMGAFICAPDCSWNEVVCIEAGMDVSLTAPRATGLELTFGSSAPAGTLTSGSVLDAAVARYQHASASRMLTASKGDHMASGGTSRGYAEASMTAVSGMSGLDGR